MTITRVTVLAGIIAALGTPALGLNFTDTGGWRTTSLTPVSTNRGDAVKVAWSVTPDGSIDDYTGMPSELQSNFTARFGSNYMNLFRTVFNRIGQVSGLQFYETTDDGARAGETTPGVPGVRGDVRVNGVNIDAWFTSITGGPWGGGAWCNLPGSNPGVILTVNTGLTWPTYQDELGIVMHEAGHAIGFGHQQIFTDATTTSEVTNGRGGYASMTGFINPDGPQFDDLYAMHRMYGDAKERNGGNDTQATATDIGNATSSAKALGTQIDGLFVTSDQTDFASIDGTSDIDYFHFHLDSSSLMSLKLTPKGPSYYYQKEGDPARYFIDASKQSDLFFDLFSSAGALLAHVNGTGLGEAENLAMVLTGGDYYVKVAGTQDACQFYRLDLTPSAVVPEPSSLLGLLGGGAMLFGAARRKRAN